MAGGDMRDLALRLWREATSIEHTPAAAYLVYRGVGLPDEVLGGSGLRFHPACPFRLDSGTTVKLPAMLAAMVDIVTGEFRGVHRTALRPDGSGKADVRGLGNPKKMLGPAAGACVKLSPDEDVTQGLHIAEGIETALACMAMRFLPMWAALSASGVARFPVLSGIESLTIFADNDQNGVGLRAARKCAARFIAAGREAVISVPQRTGRDFADEIGGAL
jgi:hypothetical protein